LEAVLEAARGKYDSAVCCGDLVGYGPRPNEVTQWCRENLQAVVRGNHDKVAVGLDDTEGYNVVAVASLHWTGAMLTEANKEYLRLMAKGPLNANGCWLMHGSPIDEDLYLVQTCDAEGMDGFLPGMVSFFGHTHRQGGFMYKRRRPKVIEPVRQKDTSYVLEIDASIPYLINPGSVGQPRDGDWRAAYAIYDMDAATVEFHRVGYDAEACGRAIREAGLPELLARRLLLGK
jgi:diadenosine tetraphosphatase ApaH/serine/threonine PP2A family protein phosphatase